VGRLRGKDEELVSGFDQEFGATKEYFNEFEGKKKRLPDEYKISVQCMSKNKNVKQRWHVRDATSGRKVGGAQICSIHQNKM